MWQSIPFTCIRKSLRNFITYSTKHLFIAKIFASHAEGKRWKDDKNTGHKKSHEDLIYWGIVVWPPEQNQTNTNNAKSD
jgi:hypothetical protein